MSRGIGHNQMQTSVLPQFVLKINHLKLNLSAILFYEQHRAPSQILVKVSFLVNISMPLAALQKKKNRNCSKIS